LHVVIFHYKYLGTGGSFPRGKVARSWSWPLTSI